MVDDLFNFATSVKDDVSNLKIYMESETFSSLNKTNVNTFSSLNSTYTNTFSSLNNIDSNMFNRVISILYISWMCLIVNYKRPWDWYADYSVFVVWESTYR